jgi:hypothetical protein
VDLATGTVPAHSTEAGGGGLLPFDAQHQLVVVIDDDVLAERVIALMLDAGVPVVLSPSACLIGQCRESVVREDLCAQHLHEYAVDQDQRERQGLTSWNP